MQTEMQTSRATSMQRREMRNKMAVTAKLKAGYGDAKLVRQRIGRPRLLIPR